MRERVKLYTHRPLQYFAKPYLDVLTDRMIFNFNMKIFTILYSELVYYEKFKQYIIIKIRKNNKRELLPISICPKSSKSLDRIFNQLNLFYNGSIAYTDNPLLVK
jgi:hypothetical protein